MNENRKRRSDWDSFFGPDDINEEFERMRRLMDAFANSAMRSGNDTFVYGFNARRGPDGKVHVDRFGNTGAEQPVMPGRLAEEPGSSGSREPLTDIISAEDAVFVTVELPGVRKDDIDLEVVGGVLRISVDTEGRRYYKEVELPCQVDPDTTKATYNNGVLDIELKRVCGEKKGRRIAIE
jgi:HSP20 family protein